MQVEHSPCEIFVFGPAALRPAYVSIGAASAITIRVYQRPQDKGQVESTLGRISFLLGFSSVRRLLVFSRLSLV